MCEGDCARGHMCTWYSCVTRIVSVICKRSDACQLSASDFVCACYSHLRCHFFCVSVKFMTQNHVTRWSGYLRPKAKLMLLLYADDLSYFWGAQDDKFVGPLGLLWHPRACSDSPWDVLVHIHKKSELFRANPHKEAKTRNIEERSP